jgi:hypothetical protein
MGDEDWPRPPRGFSFHASQRRLNSLSKIGGARDHHVFVALGMRQDAKRRASRRSTQLWAAATPASAKKINALRKVLFMASISTTQFSVDWISESRNFSSTIRLCEHKLS